MSSSSTGCSMSTASSSTPPLAPPKPISNSSTSFSILSYEINSKPQLQCELYVQNSIISQSNDMSSNEMVDTKEAGKDVDETLSINLNDALLEGEAKVPPLSHPGDQEAQNPVKNGELGADDKDDVTKDAIDNTVVQAGEAASDSKIQENVITAQDNADNVANEINIDANFKKEDNHIHILNEKSLETKAEEDEKVEVDKKVEALKDVVTKVDLFPQTQIKRVMPNPNLVEEYEATMNTPNKSFLVETSSAEGYESGTEDEQAAFMKEVETFYKENHLEFKAPKFYKEELNLLNIIGFLFVYDHLQVTSCKLWRQVGESFRPPKTCTTVSWTFRIFYEKALLEYEKHKMRSGELPFSDASLTEPPITVENQAPGSQALGSGRARRDAAARAMQGWHSHRLLGNGQVHVQSDPAGRLIISGQPEQLDNPWGVTPFKKVVSLPSRIDPHQTSAVVTLHGQLLCVSI
ncbi:hypothetical protein GH714_027933 [Hevea brasiliensis]|uniref:ARID domain-containing protein n=1 Tax=Hevea brasiliensis TaxID=3981 RepID=A0A6A6MLI4_HEVBR|nr:hypothetical protein GH714_027933 [Hevea brasiliensis]